MRIRQFKDKTKKNISVDKAERREADEFFQLDIYNRNFLNLRFILYCVSFRSYRLNTQNLIVFSESWFGL